MVMIHRSLSAVRGAFWSLIKAVKDKRRKILVCKEYEKGRKIDE